MPDASPNPDLLRSLGHLVRGLSLLFWGLPAALVVCVQTAQADYLRFFGVVPAIVAASLPLYGLILIGRFRPEERIWIQALERARFFGVINLGLSPFLFWWTRMPSSPFYTLMLQSLAVSGLIFLFLLNPMLRRLTAMLPDETLRHETVVFTHLNSVLLGLDLILVTAHFTMGHAGLAPLAPSRLQAVLERTGQYLVWFLILLTTATTMALIWKTKEVLFNSVFGGPAK